MKKLSIVLIMCLLITGCATELKLQNLLSTWDGNHVDNLITQWGKPQKEYKKVLKDANMVIMVSTMLHSIATGNMLPADVKVIVVDINQPTVTKLMDRGTWQALGIVSDVGAFLPMVANEIGSR